MKHGHCSSHCNGERVPQTLSLLPSPGTPRPLDLAAGAGGIRKTKPLPPAHPGGTLNSGHQTPCTPSLQLQKPGTHWGSSSPSVRLPELNPLDCCLSSHSSRHCQSLLPEFTRAPHLQNPVRTTLAPVAAPGTPGCPGLPAGCQSALTLPCLRLTLVFLSEFFLRIHEQMVLKTQCSLSHSLREQMHSPSTNWNELDFLKS